MFVAPRTRRLPFTSNQERAILTTTDLLGNTGEVLLRLAAATLIGAAIGINRELRGKPAGMRTHAIVSLGAAVVTLSSIDFAQRGGVFDGNAVTRAVQGIVAGIGFLGAGVILKTSDRAQVQGLTTAASIWLVACLGISCGAGQWVIVLIAPTLALGILILGRPIESVMRRQVRARRARAIKHERRRGERRHEQKTERTTHGEPSLDR